MASKNIASKTKIFISYSRKNKPFVRKLNDALDSAGIEAWVDWEGIPPSADWMEEIKSAIRGADAFVFVISPHSLASKVCAEELNLGLEYNKKLVPVLYSEPEKRARMHPKLKSTNWIYLRPKKDDFNVAISKVMESIQTDLEWVQQHTRLLQRASEWAQKRRNSSYLLRGSELEESQRWMAESSAEEGRQVLPLQAEYITASRKSALNRLRGLIIGIGAAFLISLALGVYAFKQSLIAKEYADGLAVQKAAAEQNMELAVASRNKANENMKRAEESEKVAQAQRSAALAKIYQSRAGELNASTLLAVDAYQQLPNLPDAEDILRHNASLLAIPLKQMDAGAQINKIQRNRDLTKFVTADADGKACVWSMDDGTKFFCTQQSGSVREAVFSRDGATLVTASDKGDVVFWNAENGEKIKTFHYQGTIWDLNVHSNGWWLGVARSDGYGLLDMKEMRDIYSYNGPDVRKMDFDPLGKYMALAMYDGSVSIWEVFTNNTPAGLLHRNAAALDVTYSPNGRWVVSGGTDSMARILDVWDGRTYFVSHGDWVQYTAFGPDDSWFVTVSDDGYVRVIDTFDQNGRVDIRERLRMAHDSFVTRARVSSDGQWIASTGYDHTARIWDSFSGAEVMRIPIDGIGSAVEFSSDGNRLIVGDRDGHVTLWDISRLRARNGVVKFPEFLREAYFSPDGKWLVANTNDKKIWLIQSDLLGEEDDGRLELPGVKNLTSRLAVSDDSKWIAAVVHDPNEAKYNAVLIPVDDPKAYFELDPRPISAIAFTPNGRQLVTGGEDGIVNIWDLSKKEQVDQFNFGGSIASLAVSPDGKYLAAGMEDGNRSIVWDLFARTLVQELEQFGQISSVQFSPDGKVLATGSSEGIVFLWNGVDDAFERISTLRVDGGVDSIAFTPSNTILAVGDSRGLVFLFDLSQGGEVARLRHANEAPSVSFSPDGARLAVVSQRGINLWNMEAIPFIPKDRLVETSCSLLVRNFNVNEWKNLFSESYRLICPPELTAGED